MDLYYYQWKHVEDNICFFVFSYAAVVSFISENIG